jgi:hypothetical protein
VRVNEIEGVNHPKSSDTGRLGVLMLGPSRLPGTDGLGSTINDTNESFNHQIRSLNGSCGHEGVQKSICRGEVLELYSGVAIPN